MKKILLSILAIILLAMGAGAYHYSQDTTSKSWMEHVRKTFGGNMSMSMEDMQKKREKMENNPDMKNDMMSGMMGMNHGGENENTSCSADGGACMQMNESKNSMNSINGMGGMMKMNNNSEASQETFSTDTTGLPEVEPTKLVKLKDGDTFEMTAEMVQQEVGNRTIKRLAYNRQIPGPIIEVEKNAKIKIKLTNKLDVNTTLHSHGLRLDDDKFDGLPDTMGGAQPEMKPGDSFTYELNFPDSGVFWYHPHIREDYTQEMGLYGNYHVTEENYWNEVDREEFLVLDDFSENDPFYKDFTNKTMMGRFGNILLINNSKNYNLDANIYETVRFYITNTANTRTFDFKINSSNIGINDSEMKIVGGDIGRGEKEFMADHSIIAPAERIIVEVRFDHEGVFDITHRGKKIGQVTVKNPKGIMAKMMSFSKNLRENTEDYKIIRDDFQKFLDQKIDKKLRIGIGMKMGGKTNEMRRGESHMDGKGNMMGGMQKDLDEKEKRMGGTGANHEEKGGIEWEDAMVKMNANSSDKMMEWMLIDETDVQNPKKNMDINWKFKKDQFVKIEIFNDPSSMHPMQHPIHFHGQRFVVLTRDGKPNENLQWKDTTLLRAGEKVEILLQTTNVGKWMAHCHIAEHLHAGMMFNFEVR